jgi:hypothetical protein
VAERGAVEEPNVSNFVNVAAPSGAAATDTANIQNALNTGRPVRLTTGTYRINATLQMWTSGQKLLGMGQWATTLEWHGPAAAATVVRMRDAQYMEVADLHIRPAGYTGVADSGTVPTGGFAIEIVPNVVYPAYCDVRRVLIRGMYSGVLVRSASECRVEKSHFILRRADGGGRGVLFEGAAAAGGYRLVIDDLIVNTDQPVVATMGTPNDPMGVAMNSYAYSLVINKATLMRCSYGVLMVDAVNAENSYPMWIIANDLEVDHCRQGVVLTGGEGFQATASWIGSSALSGVLAENLWRGDLAITGSRIMGNLSHGIALRAGRAAEVVGNLIGANGGSGVYIDGSVNGAKVVANTSGSLAQGALQAVGVSIYGGDRIVVAHNDFGGSTTPMIDASGAITKIIGPNI